MKRLYTTFIIISLLTIQNAAAQGLQVYDASNSYSGYTLMSVGAQSYLIDNCGYVVESWVASNSVSLMGNLMYDGNLLRMGRLTANNTFLTGGGGGGKIQIYDDSGSAIWEYDHYSANAYASHHDSEPLPNGNFLIISWEEIEFVTLANLGRNPAINANEFWSDYILEIEPIGSGTANIVWEWHMIDHLTQDWNPNASTYGVVADEIGKLDINANPFDRDWLHMNGVDYNEEFDQILISCRHVNEIYVIDHSTTTAEAATSSGGNYNNGGDFLYRYGNPENYDRGTSSDKVLHGQHDARWILEGPYKGQISIFNNAGGTNLSQAGSTADIIDPQMDANGHYQLPNAGQAFSPTFPNKVFDNGPGGSFTATNQGGCQNLPNGNMLVSTPNPPKVFELDTANNIVWEYEYPLNGALFKAKRYKNDFPGITSLNVTPTNPIEVPPSTLSNNCTVTYPTLCNIAVSINNLPTSTNNTLSINLSATPSGGTFTGPGIIFGTFNPNIAGAGFHTINYTYNDGNGCVVSTSASILVFNITYNFINNNITTISPKSLSINLDAFEDEEAQLQIVDINGQIISAQSLNVNAGNNNYQIDLQKELSAQNILTIKTKHQLISKKLLNLK